MMHDEVTACDAHPTIVVPEVCIVRAMVCCVIQSLLSDVREAAGDLRSH